VRFFAQKSQFSPHALVSGQALMSIVVFDASVIIALIKAEPLKINMTPILYGLEKYRCWR
jgi:hypothetical protein